MKLHAALQRDEGTQSDLFFGRLTVIMAFRTVMMLAALHKLLQLQSLIINDQYFK